MRGWLLLVTMLGMGCDRILGLTQVGPPIDAALDAPGPIRPVTGRISQLFVYADSTAKPTSQNVPYPPNAITLAYVTDAGSTNLDVDVNGNFTFMAPAGTYRLALTAQGDPVGRELVFATDTLAIQAAIFTRPDEVPVAGATIHANFMLVQPLLFSTGIWETEVPTLSSGGLNMFTADWMWGKLEAAKGDRVYVIEYMNAPPLSLDATNLINAVAPGVVTLADGQAAIVMGPVVRYLPADQACMAIEPEFDAAFQRLGGSITTSGKRHEWSVDAVPSDAIVPLSNAIRVAYDRTSESSTAAIVNPFGLPLLARSSIASDRIYGNTTLTSGISEWHEITVPTAGCPTEVFDTLEAPAASSMMLAGTALDVDDTKVERDGNPSIDLTWGPAKTGIGWEIELAEVGKQAAPVLIHAILTDQTRLKIPSSLLVPGHAYVFTISSLAGLTNAASGDFESAGFPFASTSIVSHTFNVL